MASLLGHRALRSSILRLPPEVRSTAFQRRAFSSTPSRKLTLVDVAIAGPNAVLDSIHALGIPWYAALPLAAALVRGAFVYYYSSLPARKQSQKQALLHPLINAKADMIRGSKFVQQTLEIQESDQPRLFRGLSYWFIELRAKNMAIKEVCKPYGAAPNRARYLVNFGMLIAFTEAIRMKCGAKDGLLPLLLSPFQWTAQRLDPESFPKPAEPEPLVTKDPAEMMAERLEALRNQQIETAANTQAQSAQATSHASEILSGQNVNAEAVTQLERLNSVDTMGAYFDPTMMAEGLGWFTDLTIPDTSLVFPAALGMTMLVTVILRPTVGKRQLSTTSPADEQALPATKEDADLPPAPPERTNGALDTLSTYWQTMPWSQRFGVWMSAAFVFVAMKLPVAILLYLIPSIALGWIQSRWLDLKYPLQQPIQKCARPMRLKVRRQWRTRAT